jgi:excisionase family DNA binding protein
LTRTLARQAARRKRDFPVTSDPGPDRLLTTQDAAQLLGVDRSTILRWIKDDLVPYVKLPAGKRRALYRIPRLALLSMIGGTDLAFEYRAAFVEHHMRTAKTDRRS